MPSSHEVPAQPRYLPRQSSTCACGVVHLLIHHSQNSASSRKLDLRDARRAASVQRAGARSTRAHGEVVQAGARQGPADAWPCTGGENRPCRRPRILHRGVARRRRAVCALLLHGGRCVRARARARVREHYILRCSRKCPLLRSCRARQRAGRHPGRAHGGAEARRRARRGAAWRDGPGHRAQTACSPSRPRGWGPLGLPCASLVPVRLSARPRPCRAPGPQDIKTHHARVCACTRTRARA